MSTHLRALLIEDSMDDAILLARELGRSYDIEFTAVDTPSALDSALDEPGWDVAITDLVMPHLSGLEAIAIVQARGLDLPVIMLSDDPGEEAAVEAMRSGAFDYVMKGNLPRLLPAVERALDETVLRRLRKKADEDVLRERQRLYDVTNFSNCGLLLLDEEGRVTYANRISEELFGPFEELKGRFCWEVFELHDPENECAALEVIRTGQPIRAKWCRSPR